MRSKPRISEVARRAGVSVGTVSHVLNGRVPVSAERRARVEAAIEALGYVPNFHAQGLRQSVARIVGICFPHASTAYLRALSETIERDALADGYRVMHVFSRHDPGVELERVKDLVRYRVDGLILLPSIAPEAALDFAAQKKLPLVLVDRPTDDARFDHVILDNRRTMRELARALLALGHRRVCFVCVSRNRLVTRHRLQGLDAARRALAPDTAIDCLEFGNDDALLRHALTTRMRGAAPPSVIIVSNSHQAARVLAILAELGARVPEDVSVVTFDDPEWSTLVQPPLSVVRQPADAIARAAWDLLLRRIRTPDAPVRAVKLDATIELRASVAAPPALSGARTSPARRRAVARAGSRRLRLR